MIIKRDRIWLIFISLLTAIILIFGGYFPTQLTQAQSSENSALSSYQDPSGRFEIGILEEYKVTPVGNSVVIESPDGNLAYTVTVRARASDAPLSDVSLAQVTIDTFSRGEKFKAGEFQIDPQNGIRLPWTGSLGKQPMSGVILTRQLDNQILLLLVAATETEANRVDGALTSLADTLKALP